MSKNMYVDNKKFHEAFLKYKRKKIEAEQNGDDPPEPDPYIGACILEIAKHLSYKSNFVGYIFREEMIGDGAENAVKAIDSFDPDNYDNPFGYFSRVIWFAFIRRIKKEKRMLYLKHMAGQQAYVEGMLSGSHEDEGYMEILNNDFMNSFVEDYEESMAKEKEKIKQRQEAKKLDEEED